MVKRSALDEHDELIHAELVHIHNDISEIKSSLVAVANDLGTVRIAELTSIRAKLADIEGDMKVLQYQSKKSGAWGGLFAGAAVSAGVSALAALLLHH